ncbi:thioredoxin-disulfide reductase [Acutalibacter caecimuris]|uniref:thioredoxin-disulfide reductase n=1 Tax=Acutalibacter caecimuris TaxID=3093657 RepID=UPI002AC99A52|nr:thioredoxin-disulfide reductase [Acutalibacter sp. M00118]
MELWDILIIGGGPAGYTAALYGARAGLRVLLLEKLAPGGQLATTDVIENYPGFPAGINGFELALKMKEGAERFGAQTVTAEVTALELAGPVKTAHTLKESYQAKSVVLATGASPRQLGLPGEAALRGKGVSYCATCDGMFYRGKTVAVAGGGNTAVADALYLSRICEQVFLIHRRDKLRAPMLWQKRLEETGKVTFCWNTQATALHTDPDTGRLEGLQLQAGDTQRRLPCAGLFVAVGQTPETALLAGQVTLDEAGYVVADETTATNIPGVFAAGDLRQKALRQVVTAVADGAMAAEQALLWLQS